MRIVIDMQGAQSESRFRGIGRYTMAFAQAVVRNRGKHEVIIALNAAFADTIGPIRAAFDGLVPQHLIVVWEAPRPFSALDVANATRRRAAEQIREAFLASLRPDWIVVTSLFEGLGDDVATSIGLHAVLPTAVVLYDLIPLIHADRYLKDNPVLDRWYREKLDHLKRANLLLSISESAGREAIDHLGFEPGAVASIGTDCDARFQPITLSEVQLAQLRAAYGIDRPVVMYTGGIDHRKNIEGLITAYATLPRALRNAHQLAVVCAINSSDRERLLRLAHDVGLSEGDLVLTGFVPDDDLLALYNACKLFVFPSWHEGFGLPALEAMRCGKAVLAANRSSLPEVAGREDALFDPYDLKSMAAMIEHALTDDAFRQDLERHALIQSQKFSWDETARRALAALEAADQTATGVPMFEPGPRRPRLAYVSPLPPDKSGIADYSAELLPELSRWYEVKVVVTHPDGVDPNLHNRFSICSVEEFRDHCASFDCVLYHFGNSHFHEHMFDLLEEIPGVVVLHDFFLSGIQAHRDVHGRWPHAWAQALGQSHGYHAVRERYLAPDTAEVVQRYPANLQVIQSALGVIVHSAFSRILACQWYGKGAATDWAVIPHLRAPIRFENREPVREALGLPADCLLVCSFGILSPHKLNDRLLKAWLASPLAHDPKAYLVFVGENHGGDYGQRLLQRIRESGLAKRIRITGWVDKPTYRQYLTAADIAVQLRTMSRGETSGTVLDCMNYGLATVVNAHGSMGYLDSTGVLMLPDTFEDNALVEVLTALAHDADRRRALGKRAQEIVRTQHAPEQCAEQYFDVIEGFYQRAKIGLPGLLTGLANQPLPESELPDLVTRLARNFPPAPRRPQLLVDVSELVQRDVKSGIQRVVRAILREWLDNPPVSFQVEPVYATTEQPGYRYARRWTSRFLGMPEQWTEDDPAEAWQGDIFFVLGFQPQVQVAQRGFYQHLRRQGVKVQFLVYDLLCVLQPQHFPPSGHKPFVHWLDVVCENDGAVCISRAVADELTEWAKENAPPLQRPFNIDWFHLGADIEHSSPTIGLPKDAEATFCQLRAHPSFLMVGTLEPRKGHGQALDAFEQLWQEGADINLVIVGKQGWMVEGLVERLCSHPELNKRIFWLEGISDEYLEKVYAASTCLIAASYGEGFGLPLIEAAQHKLPIIARDIPVFREVAGKHAFYFDAPTLDGLAQSIKTWLALYESGQHPKSDDMPWLMWQESAQQLLSALEPPHSKSIASEEDT